MLGSAHPIVQQKRDRESATTTKIRDHVIGFNSEKVDANSKLKTGGRSITPLRTNGYAIVQFDPGNAAEFEGQPDPVGQPEVVSGFVDRPAKVLIPAEVEIPKYVSGCYKQMGSEEFAKTASVRSVTHGGKVSQNCQCKLNYLHFEKSLTFIFQLLVFLPKRKWCVEMQTSGPIHQTSDSIAF